MLNNYEKLFSEKISRVLGQLDPAHDLDHVKRVVRTAKQLAKEEDATLEIVVPAAWLHDLVNLPKDHSERKKASQLAADEAVIYLRNVEYPEKYLDGIHHAICAHSFSAGITPVTVEAKIVQDADRLDALGAIGLARLFSINTQLGRVFYDGEDPFAQKRSLDDKLYGIDHIFVKLKKVSESMNTKSATLEAQRRFGFIEEYLAELKKEI